MALHLACRYHRDVAGVFALSSFLNKDSVVYRVSRVSFISLSVKLYVSVFICQIKPKKILKFWHSRFSECQCSFYSRFYATAFHLFSLNSYVLMPYLW